METQRGIRLAAVVRKRREILVVFRLLDHINPLISASPNTDRTKLACGEEYGERAFTSPTI